MKKGTREYEAPKAVRMGGVDIGQGANCLAPGSGAADNCNGNGISALTKCNNAGSGVA